MSKFSLGAAAGLLAVSLALGAPLSSPPVAMAESNGVGLRPAMGWSSWGFLRAAPTETAVEAQTKAMVTSGLASVGYEYVNVDSGWYSCPGPQGPTVDRYGRWHIDPTKFPGHGSVSGIEAVANYVHHPGLKFGLYVTPGISEQAIARTRSSTAPATTLTTSAPVPPNSTTTAVAWSESTMANEVPR